MKRADDAVKILSGKPVPSGPTTLAELADDSSHRLVTDGEKSAWNAAGGAATNITGVSQDRALMVGETVYLTYADAVSVPLHIAVSPGEYEITIRATAITVGGSGMAVLNPNNASPVGAIIRALLSNGSGGQADEFFIGYGCITYGKITCCTITANKYIHNAVSCVYGGSGNVGQLYTQRWIAAAEWVSLGTIVFPLAQSGIIAVKRLF